MRQTQKPIKPILEPGALDKRVVRVRDILFQCKCERYGCGSVGGTELRNTYKAHKLAPIGALPLVDDFTNGFTGLMGFPT